MRHLSMMKSETVRKYSTDGSARMNARKVTLWEVDLTITPEE